MMLGRNPLVDKVRSTSERRETCVPHVAAPARSLKVFINNIKYYELNWLIGQQDELVALIPYGDKRLKPRRT